MGGGDWVIRGGEMKASDLEVSARACFDVMGYHALSVYSHPDADVDTLARKACLKYAVIRVTTVGALHAAGYDLANCTPKWHCALILPTPPTAANWEELDRLFDAPIPNPARTRSCL